MPIDQITPITTINNDTNTEEKERKNTHKITNINTKARLKNKTISLDNSTLCNARRHVEVDLHFNAFLLSTTVRTTNYFYF